MLLFTYKNIYKYAHPPKLLLIVFSTFFALSACVSTGTPTTADRCVTGDCVNGQGTFSKKEGRYVKLYEGLFKEGRLWTGTVSGQIGRAPIILQEIKDGRVVWNRPYGQ